jgi:hypothetical protein
MFISPPLFSILTQLTKFSIARHLPAVVVVADAEAVVAVVVAPEARVPAADAAVALDHAVVQSLVSLVSQSSRRSSVTGRKPSARNSPRRHRSRDRAPALTACYSLIRVQPQVSLSNRSCWFYPIHGVVHQLSSVSFRRHTRDIYECLHSWVLKDRYFYGVHVDTSSGRNLLDSIALSMIMVAFLRESGILS